MKEHQLVTLNEVAQFFRKSARSILRYEADKLIPTRLDLPGRQALWLRQDLLEFVASAKAKSKQGKKLGAPRKSKSHQRKWLVRNTEVVSNDQ